MSDSITQPTLRFFEAFARQHDVPAAGEAFADAAVIHWNAQTLDRNGYMQLGYAFLAGVPDMAHAADDQFVAGDTVVTRGTWSGTNTGSLMGMPVTGKTFRAGSIVIDRVVDGKIVERWEAGDMLSMLQQLGLAPMP